MSDIAGTTCFTTSLATHVIRGPHPEEDAVLFDLC